MRQSPFLLPLTLDVEQIARLLNCELTDDSRYDGLEVQWFDDDRHGTGLLCFLSRREDRRVDYYVSPGLTLEPSTFAVGAGIGTWTTTTFEAARLEVDAHGVVADVAFTDRHGRRVELGVDDRTDGTPRRGTLLAPVSAQIEQPDSLMLVHLEGFDLVRRGRVPVTVRIGDRDARIGVLPGRALHRRELMKYAGPLTVIRLNPTGDGAVPTVDPAHAHGVRLDDAGVATIVRDHGGRRVRLELRPSMPDVATLGDGESVRGRWRVFVADRPALTGGNWTLTRTGETVQATLDVTQRWRPGRQPPLVAVVTRVVPVFRTWPLTYRWTATITLGESPAMVSRWARTAAAGRPVACRGGRAAG